MERQISREYYEKWRQESGAEDNELEFEEWHQYIKGWLSRVNTVKEDKESPKTGINAEGGSSSLSTASEVTYIKGKNYRIIGH